MVNIVVKNNFGNLRSRIIKKDQGFTKFLKEVAFILNSKIQRRVQNKGFGSKGRMRLYSKSYERFRKKRGRQIARRDLTFTGKMWQSLSITTFFSKKEVKMFFSGSEENKKAFFNDKKESFFSLNSDEKRFLNNELKKFGKL
jgi:hypothetical protein